MNITENGIAPTHGCTDHPPAVCTYQNTTGTLMANSQPGSYCGQDAFQDMLPCDGLTVRRLTPLECDRLNGYPDDWTNVPPQTEVSDEDMAFWRGVWDTWDGINDHKHHSDKQIRKWLASPATDSARYKAQGNSIANPLWTWVCKRICARYERNATLGSLFDGIGGFPLIWERLNGPGSCRWSSEVEPFCVRVTRYRFGKVVEA